MRIPAVGIPISLRYFATVRREIGIPALASACESTSSDKGRFGSSAATKRRICCLAASAETLSPFAVCNVAVSRSRMGNTFEPN